MLIFHCLLLFLFDYRLARDCFLSSKPLYFKEKEATVNIGRVTFVIWLFASTLATDLSKIRWPPNKSPFSNKLFTASQFP